MLPIYSGWDIIYGKAVFSESLIKAVSRGLLLCLRSAVDVEMPPSLQHLCLLGLLETSLGGQAQSASPEPSEVVAPKEKKARVSSPASLSTTSLVVDEISGVNRVIVDGIILDFVTRVAEWTEDDKDRHRTRLFRMDVVRKREAWAASNAIEDVDVEDDYESCWTECDEHDDEHDVDLLSELKKGLIEEFETMSSQLSRALGGIISAKVTFHVVDDDDDDASVLTLKGKISGGSTTTQFPMCGASAFKFKPGFFEISPVDVLSLKFVSNLLGLDDSATVKDLQGYEQEPPNGYYGEEIWDKTGKVTTRRHERVKEEDMKGNDPAWIMLGMASYG
jgi:hypothetical protein